MHQRYPSWDLWIWLESSWSINNNLKFCSWMDTNPPKGKLKFSLQKLIFRNAPCLRTVYLVCVSRNSHSDFWNVVTLQLLDGGSCTDCKWKIIELMYFVCSSGRNFCHCHSTLMNNNKTSIVLHCQSDKSSVLQYFATGFTLETSLKCNFMFSI